jgi:hypothetical protein
VVHMIYPSSMDGVHRDCARGDAFPDAVKRDRFLDMRRPRRQFPDLWLIFVSKLRLQIKVHILRLVVSFEIMELWRSSDTPGSQPTSSIWAGRGIFPTFSAYSD